MTNTNKDHFYNRRRQNKKIVRQFQQDYIDERTPFFYGAKWVADKFNPYTYPMTNIDKMVYDVFSTDYFRKRSPTSKSYRYTSDFQRDAKAKARQMFPHQLTSNNNWHSPTKRDAKNLLNFGARFTMNYAASKISDIHNSISESQARRINKKQREHDFGLAVMNRSYNAAGHYAMGTLRQHRNGGIDWNSNSLSNILD